MISIHAPHEGERLHHGRLVRRNTDFNPRSPRGGATPYGQAVPFVAYISIHAPHEGERRVTQRSLFIVPIFQSTLPTRGSRAAQNARARRLRFQSTLPTRGSDALLSIRLGDTQPFQSTLPTRGSARGENIKIGGQIISIHAPHEGERLFCTEDKTMTRTISIHAPHEGERRGKVHLYAAFPRIC